LITKSTSQIQLGFAFRDHKWFSFTKLRTLSYAARPIRSYPRRDSGSVLNGHAL